jgi:hypothetical protein
MYEALDNIEGLSMAQKAALRYVDEIASRLESGAYIRLSEDLQGCGCTNEMFEEAMRSIRAHARMVHFHPDRFGVKPIKDAESLLNDGLYQNQFETGLSSGGRSAFPEGDRDRWERDLFGGAYHAPGVVASERPKYGALALVRHPDGPTPRFGSCYFVLRLAICSRCSFTFSGSEQTLARERLGTIGRMGCVMAALFREVATGEGARVPWPPFVAPTLGIKNLTVPRLLDILCHELPLPPTDPSTETPGRVLDSCVEAQIHGPINIRHDIERLVIDPAFHGTPTGEALIQISRKYKIPIQRHCGFQLPAHSVPSDFRGPAIPRLARRIAVNGLVDAAVIGAAEAALYSKPELWQDWGSHEETLQHLKQLWHVVVHYGGPVRSALGRVDPAHHE